MFAETVSLADVKAFESMLRAKVISTKILTANTDRSAYLYSATRGGNLFLDPDTGLRPARVPRNIAPNYLFIDELIEIAEERPSSITMVFNHSLARGSERTSLETKLDYFVKHSIAAFAYCSHASLIVAGEDPALIRQAYDEVIGTSALPITRFVRVAAESRVTGEAPLSADY
jgi:hypothetical protein